MNGSDDLGDSAKQLRRIELSERGRALDQGNLGAPHSREVKLCLSKSAGSLKQDWIVSVAGNFADELV
jgi:hypothetical protein